MKTLFKITLILLSALLIVGGAYALRQTDWGTNLLTSTQTEHVRPEGDTFTPPDGETLTAPPDGDFDRDAASVTLESFTSFAKTLVPISLIILALNATPALFQTFRRRFQKLPA